MTDFFCKVPASHNYYFISFVYIAPIFFAKTGTRIGPVTWKWGPLQAPSHFKMG